MSSDSDTNSHRSRYVRLRRRSKSQTSEPEPERAISLIEQLPAEILTEIAEHVASDHGASGRTRQVWRVCSALPKYPTLKLNSGFEDLKALRLACHAFAFLEWLQSRLFRSITLTASPEGLAMLEFRQEVYDIAPFVRHIEFVPWKYSWAMDEQTFAKILDERWQSEHWMKRRGRAELRLPGACHNTPDRSRYAEREAYEADFERHLGVYEAHAYYYRFLFRSRRFLSAWTDVVRACSGATEFTIGYWEFQSLEDPQGQYREFGPQRL